MKFRIIRLVLVLLAVTAWHFGRPRPEAVTTAESSTAPVATTTTQKVAAKPYPFNTSVVSGEKLGSKDTLVKLEQDGYEIKLANSAEAATFKKNPAMYMAKITEAYKTAKPCPLTVCPVMGDPLDANSYSFVYEGREFKFCCDGCMDDFEKDPDKYVHMWDDAEKAALTAKKVPTS